MDYLIKKKIGMEVAQVLPLVAEFRIKHFLEFPYLYKGDLEYEKNYLAEFARNEKAVLVSLEIDGNVVAISTGIPLECDSDILKNTDHLFHSLGLNTSDFYYLSEIIVDEEHRKKGLSKKIYNEHEKIAQDWGLKNFCLATVEREESDPRRPKEYKTTDGVWEALGYRKTDLRFFYEWPTILNDTEVINAENEMAFWLKMS